MNRVSATIKRYPVLRGMVTYSIIWPTSNLIQQTVLGKRWDTYDWWQALRFSIFGCFYVAPTLYTWIRIAGIMWPKNDLRTAVIKAAVETISYTPFAMISFFFGMSLLEMKSTTEAFDEVRVKFLPTYKMGACIWPAVAIINFSIIPQKNRVPFISCCSLLWTCFLAYMKHLEVKEVEQKGIPVLKRLS